MLGTNANVPVIAITPEAEEDDDHNYLSLVEVLTDSEMLDLDISVSHNQKKTKRERNAIKLKIKLDDATTDVEDMEASDDDCCDPFVKDSLISPTTDFGILKETHKMKSKNNKGKKKLHTQSSTTNEPVFNNLNEPSINEENTDYEDCCASDHDDNLIPDIVLTEDFLESSKIVDRDTTEKLKVSPAVTPCVSDEEGMRKISKPKYLTDLVKSDKNNLTDVENLETDSDDDSATTRNCNKKLRRKKPRQRVKSKKLLVVSNAEDEGLTETENFDDPDLPACLEVDVVKTVDSDFNIQFVAQNKAKLALPPMEEDTHTDMEALDSSEEEKEYAGIQLAIVRKVRKDSETDEEVVINDINEGYHQSPSLQDLVLPKPFRKIISLTENSDKPTITLTMLDDAEIGLDAKYDGPSTDEESFSDTEALLYAAALSRGPTPEISIFDYGFEDSKEALKIKDFHLQSTSSSIVEALTDTEDITLLNKRLARKPKKFGSTLEIAQRDDNPHTDTEDLFIGNESNFLEVDHQRNDDLTDVENMAISDDEYISDDNKRAFSVTPTCMRELEGETILSRDGDGSFSNKVRLNINKRVLRVSDAPVSPMLTDTEELAASADDDPVGDTEAGEIPKELNDNSSNVFNQSNSKFKIDPTDPVLYLRGGYYRDVHTDTEDMNVSDDEEHKCKFIKKVSVDILGEDKVLLSTKNLCVNWKSCPVAVGVKNKREWNTSSGKPEEPAFSGGFSPVAAVQGEASGSWPPPITSRQSVPFRGEHSPTDAQAATGEQRSQQREVSDQHQLSEEMRKLLEEMERDSKK